jgi:hypothetical protein
MIIISIKFLRKISKEDEIRKEKKIIPNKLNNN